MTTTKQLKKMLTEKREVGAKLKPSDLLSTGSTILNLGCSGRRSGGFVKGTFAYIVGDSTAGKTMVSLTCLAEAANNPNFENYRLIFNCAEDGALMDFRKFFGKKMAEKIEMRESSSIDELYDDIDDTIQEGRPFIYVQDSMDVLTSEAENEKFQEQKAARRKGRQITGSMGDGKAKKNSANLRRVVSGLRKTASILILISQTRDNIGFGAQFDPKTRSGGKALRFYATLELWLSVRQKLKVKVKGKDRQVGIVCQIKIKKNRITGKERTIEVPIYQSVGIDDIGGCVNWLIAEGHWKKSGSDYKAPELKLAGSPDELVKAIEAKGLEAELRKLCQTVWYEIEAECEVERKRRYV